MVPPEKSAKYNDDFIKNNPEYLALTLLTKNSKPLFSGFLARLAGVCVSVLYSAEKRRECMYKCESENDLLSGTDNVCI